MRNEAASKSFISGTDQSVAAHAVLCNRKGSTGVCNRPFSFLSKSHVVTCVIVTHLVLAMIRQSTVTQNSPHFANEKTKALKA